MVGLPSHSVFLHVAVRQNCAVGTTCRRWYIDKPAKHHTEQNLGVQRPAWVLVRACTFVAVGQKRVRPGIHGHLDSESQLTACLYPPGRGSAHCRACLGPPGRGITHCRACLGPPGRGIAHCRACLNAPGEAAHMPGMLASWARPACTASARSQGLLASCRVLQATIICKGTCARAGAEHAGFACTCARCGCGHLCPPCRA
jgi:hypothetical protein